MCEVRRIPCDGSRQASSAIDEKIVHILLDHVARAMRTARAPALVAANVSVYCGILLRACLHTKPSSAACAPKKAARVPPPEGPSQRHALASASLLGTATRFCLPHGCRPRPNAF